MNSRQFAVIIAITFFVGMVWLIADIIFNTKASIPANPKLETLLEPLTPTFNQRVLDIVSKETLSTDQITVKDAEVPTPSETPTPTPNPISTDTPQATESAVTDLDL